MDVSNCIAGFLTVVTAVLLVIGTGLIEIRELVLLQIDRVFSSSIFLHSR